MHLLIDAWGMSFFELVRVSMAEYYALLEGDGVHVVVAQSACGHRKPVFWEDQVSWPPAVSKTPEEPRGMSPNKGKDGVVIGFGRRVEFR